jgi:hypothetical protein
MLGRFVRNFQDPTFDYAPLSPRASLSPEVYNTFLMTPQHENATTITARASKDSRLMAKLQSLLSFSSSAENGGSTSITSPRVTIRRLRLEPDYFAALSKVDTLREKILDMCPRGDRIYLVVGTMSFHTAEVKTMGSIRNEVEAKVTIAAGTAAAAAAGGPLPAFEPGMGNVELESGHASSSDWTMESTATAVGQDGVDDPHAEEIFAVAYRIVRRDLVGLGKNVQMTRKTPSCRGGQHFGGSENESDDEDDEEKEELDPEAASQSLKLSTEDVSPATFGRAIGSPAILDRDSRFLFFP